MIICAREETSIDYPGKFGQILFTSGCNFRCGFCHNPELITGENNQIDLDSLLKDLKARVKGGWYQAVCISGGEPTLQKDLPEFVKKLKELGILVKIDSNGSNPEMLQILLEQGNVDYVAMDIKSPREKYISVIGVDTDLKKIDKSIDIDTLEFYELNKHTKSNEIYNYLEACEKGKDVGLITEAGCPGVADPGAEIVSLAHKNNIKVIPLIGPSSIILALMASGMNGQNFVFLGYLPIDKNARIKKIKYIESVSAKQNQTQIFIETPYRNMQLLQDIISSCNENTQLCIASDITGQTESIKTKSIKNWKEKLPNINKIPAIFLIHVLSC